jgi:hypothetical protein
MKDEGVTNGPPITRTYVRKKHRNQISVGAEVMWY